MAGSESDLGSRVAGLDMGWWSFVGSPDRFSAAGPLAAGLPGGLDGRAHGPDVCAPVRGWKRGGVATGRVFGIIEGSWLGAALPCPGWL